MKRNNKGFTLAELLIVVAIIAVLVAIAIPIFVNQLEKARESTDVANIRDYYAEIAVALVNGDLDPAKTTQTLKVTGNSDAKVTTPLTGASGDFVVTVNSGNFKVNQTIAQWQSGDQEVAGAKITAATDMVGKTSVTYTFTVTEATATSPASTYLSAIGFGS